MEIQSPILTIVIPTYNRASFLEKNLKKLAEIIRQNDFTSQIELLVSNNCSTDDTALVFEGIAKAYEDICFHPFSQSENIGVLANIEFIIQHASGTYIMYLGDDDYLHPKFLPQVIEALHRGESLTCILPSYQNIDLQGALTGRAREAGMKNRTEKAGFLNTYHNSWKAHQMSGLVFRRDIVLQARKESPIHNMYPFILDAIATTHQGGCYLCREYPVLVTRPPQSQKTWGYGENGLIDDVFQNYKVYHGYNHMQNALLQLHFLDMQYWRFAMYLKRGGRAFWRCFWQVMIGKNTLLFTRICWPFAAPIILIKQFIQKLCTGKLSDTLKTEVDI